MPPDSVAGSGGITLGSPPLYAAAETPALWTAPDLLARFVAADLVDRIHRGTRDVVFDGIPLSARPSRFARPIRLSRTFGKVSHDRRRRLDPRHSVLEWDDDPAEALAFARQCFADLCDDRARGRLRIAKSSSARKSDRSIICPSRGRVRALNNGSCTALAARGPTWRSIPLFPPTKFKSALTN